MTQESHDHNFKNLFLDFPKEALEWILPQASEEWGKICHIEFLRQEPKKHKLADAHFSLDMPILYSFENRQLLLWLVEFQEDKAKFSVYKLLRYTTDLMEAYPQATVIPAVIFTDRKKWLKDVKRNLETRFGSRLFLHFEYIFVRLFEFNARDYYQSRNPLVKILLPKMNYTQEERWEVIRRAYIGLAELLSPPLFEKYADFIDIYAEVQEEERNAIYEEISEHKETIMILQMLKKEYREEGREEGRQEGRQEGILYGNTVLLSRQIAKKYHLSLEELTEKLEGLNAENLLYLGELILESDSFENIEKWIQGRKHKQ